MIKRILIIGGGSAGFLAALALKVKIPHLQVVVVRSRDIGIIGVGEGSTVALTKFLHGYLKISPKKFFDIARPTWKLGLKFIWGPRRYFHYDFSPGILVKPAELSKNHLFYCEESMEFETPVSAMMSYDRVFERTAAGGPIFHDAAAYHFENEKFVTFLEDYATSLGVKIVDETVLSVQLDENGVSGLQLSSGRVETADLFVDASGFSSLLLGRTLQEPFVDFGASLFCDRAVVGGWDRAGGPDACDQIIKPYTTCETMNSGWAWQIEHEFRINRGYVYSSGFMTDEDAEREFRSKNPRIQSTRMVKFRSGRFQRGWVKNVFAVGNAAGFVEPLEATALGAICESSRLLADGLVDSNYSPGPRHIERYNIHFARYWDAIRGFIAIHYKFNTRIDTPFWHACRESTDLAGAQQYVVYFSENGPSAFWGPTIIDAADSFGVNGYSTLLVGQKVPYQKRFSPTAQDANQWEKRQQQYKAAASHGLTVTELLATIRSPKWKWTG